MARGLSSRKQEDTLVPKSRKKTSSVGSFELEGRLVRRLLTLALARGGEFAEIFFESGGMNRITMEVRISWLPSRKEFMSRASWAKEPIWSRVITAEVPTGT